MSGTPQLVSSERQVICERPLTSISIRSYISGIIDVWVRPMRTLISVWNSIAVTICGRLGEE